MSEEQRDREDRLVKQQEEKEMARKAKETRSLQASVDKKIGRLAPRTRRRLGTSLTKLHTAHQTRKGRIARERETKKLMTKQKAKATRAFNKQTKEYALDADNKEVVRALMDRAYPLELSVKVARYRQDLQELERARMQRLVDLQEEIEGLEYNLEEADANIRSVSIDVDAMTRKQGGDEGSDGSQWDSDDEDGSWLEFNLRSAQEQLVDMKNDRDRVRNLLRDRKRALEELQSELEV